MEYKVAKKIRDRSLSSLIADSPGGLFSSVGKAVSLKMKAKATGLQEKFDPMNIAKVITGGSRLAPALLGRLTGRKQTSIEYFAGNKRQQNRGVTQIPTAEQPAATATVVEDSSAILMQIFSFMKKSRDEDKKAYDTKHSFDEERQNEAQRKHDEFIEVLKKFTNYEETKQKKDTFGGIMEFIGNLLGTLKEWFKRTIDIAFAAWEWIKGLKWLTTLGTWAKGMLASAGWKEMFTAAARSTPALAFLAPWLMVADTKEEIRNDPNNPKYDDNPYAMQIRGEAKTEGEATEINRRKSLKQVPRKQIDMFVNSDQTDEELKTEFGADRAMLKKWLDDNKNPSAMWQAPVTPLAGTDRGAAKVGTVTPVDSTKQKAEAKEMPATAATDTKAVKAGEKIASVPTPIQTPPASAPVSNLVTQNNDLNTSAVAGIRPAPGPIVSSTSSAGSIPDNQVTTSASQRDNTHILNKVIKSSKSNGY